MLVDASADATTEIARRERPRGLRVVRDAGNVARTRQLGAEQAATKWLLYLDADVELAPDYLARRSS